MRTPDALQMLEIQRGEVEYFKTLAYRFEIAWEESDLQSMVDLQAGLQDLMEKEVAQLSDKQNLSKLEADWLAQEKVAIEKLKATKLTPNAIDFGKKAEGSISIFNDFIQWIEADFSAQAEATRQVEKQ